MRDRYCATCIFDEEWKNKEDEWLKQILYKKIKVSLESNLIQLFDFGFK